MSDLNKIPFGLRVEDDTFVDVCEVANGKGCGCVCPSCYTPLTARQGNIRVWYFAHNTKYVYEQTKNLCEYSFYTSVRLMARQVIGNQLQLNLPGLTGRIEYYQSVRWAIETQEISVTEPTTIILENLDVDTTFSGASVDIVGTIQDYQFVIYFTHPDRVVPENLFEPANLKCGIIEISLHFLFKKFAKLRSENKSYREILTDFLSNDIESKKWIYHPGFKREATKAIADLKKRPYIIDYYAVPLKGRSKDKQLKRSLSNSPPDQVLSLTRFECLMCHSQWEGPKVSGRFCQKCKEYLFTKIIG
jgi:hypothetical protein